MSDNEYKRRKYDAITFFIPKGGKVRLQAVAADYNWTVSKLIVNALERLYGVDLHTPAAPPLNGEGTKKE